MRFAYLIEPPFNDRGADGALTGCDIELVRYVFHDIGVVDAEFVEAGFAELLPGLANGRWQMTTGLFITEERRKLAAFSRPIWALADGLLVARGNPLAISGYASLAKLGGARLAVIRDQIQHRTALEKGVPEARILVFDSYAGAADAVLQGQVDAYASVARAHMSHIAQHASIALEVVTVMPDEREPAFGAFGVSRQAPEFLQAVNSALDRYLGSEPHLAMMARFGFRPEETAPVVLAQTGGSTS